MLRRLGGCSEERLTTTKTSKNVTIGVERRAMIRVFESEGAKDLCLYNERKLDNREVSFETGFELMGLVARKEKQ